MINYQKLSDELFQPSSVIRYQLYDTLRVTQNVHYIMYNISCITHYKMYIV